MTLDVMVGPMKNLSIVDKPTTLHITPNILSANNVKNLHVLASLWVAKNTVVDE